ncbi:MAG: nucleotidyltransferase substrate binding protein [Chloroherpetonaceae bacterium]|nr:nucleotidyltransferase substrate binding protein [Chloroherpetonaceae bacterium]
MQKDIRWKQRFENFSKAFHQLEKAIQTVSNPSDLEKEGIIQRFEFTHELSWKVMKDFLEEKGIREIIGSKDAVRLAFQNGIITNGEVWMEMIETRNKTVHSYLEEILNQEYKKIREKYYPLLSDFHKKMETYQ